MPHVAHPNYLFHNNGNLTFTNVAAAWGGGVGAAGFSNGAAYVDLDNDGALDLVVNNVDRKSTRLNSSHSQISYAVFCLKKKKKNKYKQTSHNIPRNRI